MCTALTNGVFLSVRISGGERESVAIRLAIRLDGYYEFLRSDDASLGAVRALTTKKDC